MWHNYLLECDKPITLFIRSDPAGISTIFSSAFSSFDANWKEQHGTFDLFPKYFSNGSYTSHKLANQNLGMISSVSITPYSLGYLPLSLAKANTISSLVKVVNKRGQVHTRFFNI